MPHSYSFKNETSHYQTFQTLNSHPMKKPKNSIVSLKGKAGFSTLLILISSISAQAQDGLAGIAEADRQVRSYFAAGTSLMYAIGAVLGLIGAVKVYQKWNAGDPDTGKVAAAWFGSCVFLVVVATVIQSFFGV
jgi:hypothetical protein